MSPRDDLLMDIHPLEPPPPHPYDYLNMRDLLMLLLALTSTVITN